MPKLYYTPTSCGAASFIAAIAAGVHIETEQVIKVPRTTASGVDFYTINPKGNVPTLILDDGTILNEGAATLQFIADMAPGTIAPAFGTTDRYVLINILNYLGSEVHTAYAPLFYGLEGEARVAQYKKIDTKLEYLQKHVLGGGKKYVVGDKFTIADSYLYVILSWGAHVGVDLTRFPELVAYHAAIGALPFVVKAHALMATSPAST